MKPYVEVAIPSTQHQREHLSPPPTTTHATQFAHHARDGKTFRRAAAIMPACSRGMRGCPSSNRGTGNRILVEETTLASQAGSWQAQAAARGLVESGARRERKHLGQVLRRKGNDKSFCDGTGSRLPPIRRRRTLFFPSETIALRRRSSRTHQSVLEAYTAYDSSISCS